MQPNGAGIPILTTSSNLSRIEGLFADGIEQPGGIEGPPSADSLPTEDLPLIEPLGLQVPSAEFCRQNYRRQNYRWQKNHHR